MKRETEDRVTMGEEKQFIVRYRWKEVFAPRMRADLVLAIRTGGMMMVILLLIQRSGAW